MTAGEKTAARVAAIKEFFPGYDTAADSYANRTSYTGVRRCAEAQRIAEEVGGLKRCERRKNSARLTVRVTPKERDILRRRMARLGFETDQSFLSHLLKREIEKEENRK